MAIRRPLIDMIDRGLDPKVAHKTLDKRGMLISSSTNTAPVIAAEDVKENLLTNEEKEVLTENSVKGSDEKNEAPKEKKESSSKKTSKHSKLV